MSRHVFHLKPRWSDLDAYAHVNNVTWLEYLQEARVDMLFVHAPAQGAEGLAEGVLVVRAADFLVNTPDDEPPTRPTLDLAPHS
ncbi:MAG TPA: thioesterase family protein [Nocardioidaceae bacterium]|nr:thioesterase family protein [Nocardioidaceae bacterium]